MITGPRAQFVARCRQRGYSWQEVAACVVSDDGKTVTVDETHQAYPRMAKPGGMQVQRHAIIKMAGSLEELRSMQAPQPSLGGPGTELKKLLKAIGITASPGCSCNKRAAIMDQEERKSPGWCAAHTDEIVGWLREEATKRKLPFVDLAGRTLVNLAIRRAKKGSKK